VWFVVVALRGVCLPALRKSAFGEEKNAGFASSQKKEDSIYRNSPVYARTKKHPADTERVTFDA
jgi:hypothetical protein